MNNPAIIDVRETDEFEAEHVHGSIHVPLSEVPRLAAATLAGIPKDRNVLIMCRSGKRAGLAMEVISKLGLGHERISVFEGGILRWKELARPTKTKKANHFPIMRQVQLIAGSLVVTSIALGYWVSPAFLAVGAFMGLGLTVAGATGFCGMARLLMLAPWNR